MKNSKFFRQLEKMTETGCGRGLFHKIHFNNYTFVLVCRHVDYDFYCSDTTNSFSVLNNLVIGLYGFFKRIYDDFVQENPPANPGQTELYRKVALFLEYWKRDLDSGNYFLSYNYIKITGQGFDMMGLPYLEELRGEGHELLGNLLQFDKRYQHLVKTDLYMNPEDIPGFFTRLCNELAKQPELYQAIERVEIANPGFSETFVTKAVNLQYYPQIIIYPGKHISSISSEPIQQLQRLLNEMMNSYAGQKMDTAFCTLFAKNATITQGYRNYKKILQVLNLLGELYDEGSGYSLFKQKQGEAVMHQAPVL